MSNSVDIAFIQQWTAEAHHSFQRMKSCLRPHIRVVQNVTGSTYNFPVIGSVTAIRNKARHADLISSNAAHSTKSATIVPVHAPEYIDDLDQVRTNIDLRKQYTEALMASVSREMDKLILEAIEAQTTASETALPTANTLNAAGMAKMSAELSENDVPKDGERWAFVSPGAMADIIADSALGSRDYMQEQALSKGFIERASGFKVQEYTGLSNGAAGATERRCWFGHKNSVGLAIAKDFTLSVKEVPQKDSWLVLAKFAAGAVAIDETGLAFCDVTN